MFSPGSVVTVCPPVCRMLFLEFSATIDLNYENILFLLLTSVGTTGNTGEIHSLKRKYFKYCVHEMHIHVLLYLPKSYSYITVNNHLENLSHIEGTKNNKSLFWKETMIK